MTLRRFVVAILIASIVLYDNRMLTSAEAETKADSKATFSSKPSIGYFPYNREKYSAFDKCIAAKTLFTEKFTSCERVQFLGLNIYPNVIKKCKFMFHCNVTMEITRMIDLPVDTILENTDPSQILN